MTAALDIHNGQMLCSGAYIGAPTDFHGHIYPQCSTAQVDLQVWFDI